jgi:hypothetical protein
LQQAIVRVGMKVAPATKLCNNEDVQRRKSSKQRILKKKKSRILRECTIAKCTTLPLA